jgi:hypothetical protein
MTVTIHQLLGDVAVVWGSVNPILEDREPGIETDTLRWKIGDGVTPWNDLDYVGSGSVPVGGTAGQFLKKDTIDDFDTSWVTLAIGSVGGLQVALDAKLDDSQATAIGLAVLGAVSAAAARSALGSEAAITAGTTAQFWRGDKTWQLFTTLPVSTAQQAALDLKAPLASPALTGLPTAPTQTAADNSTKLATTGFVKGAITDLIALAPGALDTLDELAAAMGDDPNFATTVTTNLAGKLVKTANLSDLSNAAIARQNLGLEIGVQVQAYNAKLATLAALTVAANQLVYWTSPTVAAVADFSPVARTLAAQTTQAAMRSTGLGLGSASVEAVGTSGNTVPKNNTANIFGANQAIMTGSAHGGLTVTQTGSTSSRLTMLNATGKMAFFGVYDSAYGFGLAGAGGFGADNDIVVFSDQGIASGGSHAFSVRTGGYDTTQERLWIGPTGVIKLTGGLSNYANDAAAAAAVPPIPIGGFYRNGSVVMIRVT